jgi:hypothetical protein
MPCSFSLFILSVYPILKLGLSVVIFQHMRFCQIKRKERYMTGTGRRVSNSLLTVDLVGMV